MGCHWGCTSEYFLKLHHKNYLFNKILRVSLGFGFWLQITWKTTQDAITGEIVRQAWTCKSELTFFHTVVPIITHSPHNDTSSPLRHRRSGRPFCPVPKQFVFTGGHLRCCSSYPRCGWFPRSDLVWHYRRFSYRFGPSVATRWETFYIKLSISHHHRRCYYHENRHHPGLWDQMHRKLAFGWVMFLPGSAGLP